MYLVRWCGEHGPGVSERSCQTRPDAEREPATVYLLLPGEDCAKQALSFGSSGKVVFGNVEHVVEHLVGTPCRQIDKVLEEALDKGRERGDDVMRDA